VVYFQFVSYSDSDSRDNLDDKKSVPKLAFYMKCTTFTCSSTKQAIVILFICDVEYVVASPGIFSWASVKRST